MRDDLDRDGAQGSEPPASGGKRRAPEPAEAPRRRRRSLETGDGVSVSDLVERHASRTDLHAVDLTGHAEPSRHQAPAEPPATRSGRRRAAEDHGPSVDLGQVAPGTSTGRRAKPEPDEPATGRRARRDEQAEPAVDPLGVVDRRAHDSGAYLRSALPERSRRAAEPSDRPGAFAPQPPDPIPAGPRPRRAAEQTPPEPPPQRGDSGTHARPAVDPTPDAFDRRPASESGPQRRRQDSAPLPRRQPIAESPDSAPVRRPPAGDFATAPGPAVRLPNQVPGDELPRRGPRDVTNIQQAFGQSSRTDLPKVDPARRPNPNGQPPPAGKHPAGPIARPPSAGAYPANPQDSTGAIPVVGGKRQESPRPVSPQRPVGRPTDETQTDGRPIAGNARPQPFPGNRPGEANRTGAHPLPTDANRTGQRPIPNEANRTGGHPIAGEPNRAGAHPGEANRTGAYPIPGEPNRPSPHPVHGEVSRSRPQPFPANGTGRPTPGAGAHPIPPGDAHPFPGNRSGAHPLPGNANRTGGHPIPGGPRPTGQHPGEPNRQAGPPIPSEPNRTGAHPIPAGPRPPMPPTADAGQSNIAERLGGPPIPRQLPPGQSSMPPAPKPDDDAPKLTLTPPPAATGAEILGLTTEMEAIGEHTQKRRKVDQTLARFSKVHDELKAEEKARRSKLSKLNPWAAQDAEIEDHFDELAMLPAEPTMVVKAPPEPQPQPEPEPADDDEPSTRLREKKARKQTKASRYARFFSLGVAILVFIASGVGWGFKEWAGGNIDHVRALDPNSQSIQNAEAQRGDENFLLVGSDTRDGASAEDGVGDTSAVAGARSDTVMIAHIPADRSRVVVVSFPRDLEINRPDCEQFDPKTNSYTGQTAPGHKTAKLNTAYQFGGPLCLTQVLQKISGLKLTRFVGIDFNGFKGMVDAVDGVNVCVEKPLYDTFMKKWIVKDAGTAVELRGDQALDFVRTRHVRGDPTSDYGRIIRQQRFLSSLLRKAMSGQVLLDAGKLSAFAKSFADATFGDNIDFDSLFQLGQSMQGLEAGRVTFITVPTVGIENDRHNEVLRADETNALFRAIVNDQPLPGEAPSSHAAGGGDQQAMPQNAPIRQAEPVDPKTVKIQVLNGGNSTGGIARTTANKLTEFGYSVVNINPTAAVAKTVIRYGKGKEAAAQTLASSVPGAALEEDAAATGAVILIIGPDFKGEVVSPGGAGPGAPAQEKLPSDLNTVNGGDVTCA